MHYSGRMVLANALPLTCVLVCPTQTHIIENRQTNRYKKGANDVAMQGFIPITHHAKVRYSLSSVHSEWFTNHPNHIHTFSRITRMVATKEKTATRFCDEFLGIISCTAKSQRFQFHRFFRSRMPPAFFS